MSEDRMAFPNTREEFEKMYGFTDNEEIYTNGSRLIQSFRVEQWLEHLQAVPVKRGEWLPKHHYIAGYEFVSGHICSECGGDAMNAEGDDFLTDYCPNCGARMD